MKENSHEMRKPMTKTFPQNQPGHTGAVVSASDSMSSGCNVSGIDRIEILPVSQPHKLTHCVAKGSDDNLTTCFTDAINGDYPNDYRLRATGTANGATRHLK